LYKDALTSDYADVQGGTTGEGIHAGVMAGTVLIALQSFAGLNLKGDMVKFDPHLPEHWRSIGFDFNFRNISFKCTVCKNLIRIKQANQEGKQVDIMVKGKVSTLIANIQMEIIY
jgi:trehalose/maltose hydrolase-like predicted phosphorylase